MTQNKAPMHIQCGLSGLSAPVNTLKTYHAIAMVIHRAKADPVRRLGNLALCPPSCRGSGRYIDEMSSFFCLSIFAYRFTRRKFRCYGFLTCLTPKTWVPVLVTRLPSEPSRPKVWEAPSHSQEQMGNILLHTLDDTLLILT